MTGRARWLAAAASLVLGIALVPPGSGAAPAAVAGARYEVVAAFPHDSTAWTQGLAFHRGVLHETTGLYGESSLRRVDLATGRVMKIRHLPDHLFGEGLAFVDGRAFVLTWKERRALVFHPRTFGRLGRFDYAGQGWGLTSDGRRLVMSDGSDVITFRDPDTFAALRRIRVVEDGAPVTRLNELEWIDGRIWANVWQTADIVVIEPRDGRVVERIDLSTLLARERTLGNPSEMNGIAYLPATDRLFVTGKRWRNVYEIERDR
jgi:glutaminyl-peptide cyclotransferase